MDEVKVRRHKLARSIGLMMGYDPSYPMCRLKLVICTSSAGLVAVFPALLAR